MDDVKYQPPESEKGDVAHALTRAGISSVPYVGAAAVELFQLVVAPPLDKRRQRWMEEVGIGLRSLEEKVDGFSAENLQKNDSFVSAVMHASNVAIRNHQQEKIDALRNAVLNVALGREIDEEMQAIFLSLVDDLTVTHIRILRFFQAPEQFARQAGVRLENMYTSSPSHILEATFADLRGRRDFYDQIVRDLHNRGLLGIDSLHTMMTPHGAVAKRTTDAGDRFVNFISSPLE